MKCLFFPLFRIYAILNFIYSLPQIYEEFYHTINNADHKKDLMWWSNNHGDNMAMNWPTFVVCIQHAERSNEIPMNEEIKT